MARQDHLVVAIVAKFFEVVDDGAIGLLPPPLLQGPALILSREALILTTGATALSPRGLSFPSDGEPLPAISSVGAATTLGAVQELLQQARRRLGFFLSCRSNF